VTVTNPIRGKSGGGYKVGLGLQYDFTPSARPARRVGENYRSTTRRNKGNINTLMVGLVYMFGAKPRRAPPKRPPPVADSARSRARAGAGHRAGSWRRPSSMQHPRRAVPRSTRRPCQRESEERINKVGIFMTKYPKLRPYRGAHRRGRTPVDNMKLSEAPRQERVTYLVDKGGIARPALKSVGYGETRPLGDNKTEAGRRLNRRINAIIALCHESRGSRRFPSASPWRWRWSSPPPRRAAARNTDMSCASSDS